VPEPMGMVGGDFQFLANRLDSFSPLRPMRYGDGWVPREEKSTRLSEGATLKVKRD